jgi:hypothetical protein
MASGLTYFIYIKSPDTFLYGGGSGVGGSYFSKEKRFKWHHPSIYKKQIGIICNQRCRWNYCVLKAKAIVVFKKR